MHVPSESLTPLGDTSKAFLSYWRGLTDGGNSLPNRRDIKPEELLGFIDHIWLYHRDGHDFRCVIMGNHVQERWGRPVIGKWFRELLPEEYAARLAGRLMEALENRFVGHGYNDLSKSDIYAERVYAPLLDEAGNPAFILGVSSYLERTAALKGRTGTIPLGKTNFYDALTLEYSGSVTDD